MENNGVSIPIKDLLFAYRVITRVMKENGYTQDNSFRRVQSWLANAVCDNMNDGDIIEA